ncbi:MAG TPA: hypothetical protein VH062_02210 [Polyangiaceae bacterium]|jgi:hypothetical protein|nr:hypothetical protein [Polyangiaceae bacterium]
MSEADPFATLAGNEKLREDDRAHVWEQVAAKKWDDLGAIELADGSIGFPDEIYKRDPKTGTFVAEPIVLRVLRGPDMRKARVEAYGIAKSDKIDPEKDKILFEDLEELCKLWFAIRSPKFPYEQLAFDARELEKSYDRPSLEQVNGKLAQYRRVLDPKLGGMRAEEMTALSAALVARQNLAPLFAFDDATQEIYFITMAQLHLAYLKARSSPGSSEPSTAG